MTENNNSLNFRIKEIENIVDDFVESIDDHTVKIDTSLPSEQRLYGVFKSLVKLNMLNIIKETYKLTNSDIKALDKTIKEYSQTMNSLDVYNLENLTEKFSEKDINYMERLVKV